ncbi:acyl-CoA thioesterase [Halostagnicola kamekurae]|nr:thioesterase family protein [Halostagnicola kamekurae]
MSDTHITSIPVRFQDIDSTGHVNNTKYPNFLAEARASYYEEVLEYDLREANTVIVHMSIDYADEITRDDTVDIEVQVTNLGASSITMEYSFQLDGKTVARAETIQVVYDRAGGHSKSIPSAWRRRIENHEEL